MLFLILFDSMVIFLFSILMLYFLQTVIFIQIMIGIILYCYYLILLFVISNLLYKEEYLHKNYLQQFKNYGLLKTCFKYCAFMVFSEQFFLKGIVKIKSVSIFLSVLSFFIFPFFYFLVSPINLKAFLIQYLTISYLVFFNFKNLTNNVRKINSSQFEF